ncbi:hypothetical protein ACH5RR_000126 [Cinchona calisaya]|uniref:Membrane-associated kinase regulator 6 n=1 Tax=Cinchona calisaya TaxID=153742 RepID=A0ABD3AZT4_9GENT
MENSQPLATDSFSYSWLINRKPSFDGLLESLRPSLDCIPSETIPIVHHLNYKIFKDDHQDFDFNVTPGSKSSIGLVDADEIFLDGLIKPVFPNRDWTKIQASTSSVPTTPISLAVTSGPISVRKWTKPSNKVLQKCFSLLMPFCSGFECSRKSIRVDDLDRKVLEVRSRKNSQEAPPDCRTEAHSAFEVCKGLKSQDTKSWRNSPQASPLRSPPHYTDDWCDIESSIHEAILHCKRSLS